MLTVAYCRVSTEDQATEGFSIEGQTEKLKAYAELHDLGDVVVITDPGRSGKNLDRPGLQQLLGMVDAGHVRAVLIWRLDRLSRNLADLILLADRFGQADVDLHSFSEKLDLSSATGRMFYGILGSFAQFYREQLSENVRMGMAQAMRQGRWVNRPPTGYDLVDGLLVPNDDAGTIRRVFRMRGDGASQGDAAAATGVNYSTVGQILKNRAYLGEIRHKDQWLPGVHEPLVTAEQFDAAHRGRVPGRKRGRDLMSGRVTCAGCGRRMSIDSNGQGQIHYRCKHRGTGCKIPARSNRGLLAAAGLGISLLYDTEIRTAIRKHLEDRRAPDPGRRRRAPDHAATLAKLRDQRQKLLRLHYDDKISADQFGDEQARLTLTIEALEAEQTQHVTEQLTDDDLITKFDQLTARLEATDLRALWQAATQQERRILLDELLAGITIHHDRLAVEIHGAPPLNVAFAEVGLRDSEFRGVGGGT
jgi:site-specific DNA recombinase